jgi:hypothetical protein
MAAVMVVPEVLLGAVEAVAVVLVVMPVPVVPVVVVLQRPQVTLHQAAGVVAAAQPTGGLRYLMLAAVVASSCRVRALAEQAALLPITVEVRGAVVVPPVLAVLTVLPAAPA